MLEAPKACFVRVWYPYYCRARLFVFFYVVPEAPYDFFSRGVRTELPVRPRRTFPWCLRSHNLLTLRFPGSLPFFLWTPCSWTISYVSGAKMDVNGASYLPARGMGYHGPLGLIVIYASCQWKSLANRQQLWWNKRTVTWPLWPQRIFFSFTSSRYHFHFQRQMRKMDRGAG